MGGRGDLDLEAGRPKRARKLTEKAAAMGGGCWQAGRVVCWQGCGPGMGWRIACRHQLLNATLVALAA